MPVHLVFLFLFQSGLAFAFTFFIGRVILGGSTAESAERIKSGMRKMRLLALLLAVLLAPVFFIAYYKSLPEGKSWTLAAWPAAWIFMILFAVVIALTLVIRSPDKRPEAAGND